MFTAYAPTTDSSKEYSLLRLAEKIEREVKRDVSSSLPDVEHGIKSVSEDILRITSDLPAKLDLADARRLGEYRERLRTVFDRYFYAVDSYRNAFKVFRQLVDELGRDYSFSTSNAGQRFIESLTKMISFGKLSDSIERIRLDQLGDLDAKHTQVVNDLSHAREKLQLAKEELASVLDLKSLSFLRPYLLNPYRQSSEMVTLRIRLRIIDESLEEIAAIRKGG